LLAGDAAQPALLAALVETRLPEPMQTCRALVTGRVVSMQNPKAPVTSAPAASWASPSERKVTLLASAALLFAVTRVGNALVRSSSSPPVNVPLLSASRKAIHPLTPLVAHAGAGEVLEAAVAALSL